MHYICNAIKNKYMQKHIPTDIVLEAIGCCRFKGNEEEDIQIAENLASNQYESMESLLSTMDGFVQQGKLQKNWAKEKTSIEENPFFRPYYKKHGYDSN